MRNLLQLQNGKKGQAAMEFLMTYGWALLVVLVAIGALAFFGVLNPGQFLPDQCTFFAGVSCLNYIADDSDNALTFTVQNGLGYSMTTTTIAVKKSDGSALLGVVGNDCTASFTLNDGATKTCKYTISDVASIKLRLVPTVQWTDEGTNVRVRDGSIAVTVQA